MDEDTGKVALITGITGQDGAYLAEFLLNRGYTVYGTFRRTSSANFWRIASLGIHEHPRLHLVEHDLTDAGAGIRLLERIRARSYNPAAQSFVGLSFDQPVTTAEITAVGALYLLEAVRIVDRKIRFYQASTSEMFGKVQAIPQDENTSFILVARTVLPSCSRTGQRSTTGSPMASSPPAEFFLITSHRCADWNS